MYFYLPVTRLKYSHLLSLDSYTMTCVAKWRNCKKKKSWM